MAMRDWAFKPGDLKGMSTPALHIFAVRCFLRVEPWIPRGSKQLCTDNLRFVLNDAWEESHDSAEIARRHRALNDSGATECYRWKGKDEPRGLAANYATLTLALAVTGLRETGTDLKKHIIKAAKHAGSIPAVWAHAGHVTVPPKQDPVEIACSSIWAEMRADLDRVAAAIDDLAAAKNRVRAVRDLAPLWDGLPPPWAEPSK